MHDPSVTRDGFSARKRPRLRRGSETVGKDTLDFDGLVLILGGHTAFQLCWAGVQLSLFEHLSRRPGLAPDELRAEVGLEERPFRILLTGLLALKVVLREGGGLRNSAIAEELLVRANSGNWVDLLDWQRYIVYPGEIDFLDSLKENRNVGLRRFPGDEGNLYARLAHDAFLERVFQDAMASLSRSANELLVSRVDFSGITHLVDAGGGDGTNLMAIACRNPGLRGTVFDSPSVCRIAKENIARQGFGAVVSTHEGDLFTTPFPAGTDAVLLAHMLTIWSPERNVRLLRRIHRTLPAGGQVIVFNMMASDDGAGPVTAALGSPYFLTIATGEGMLYCWAEFESFLQRAGFRRTRRLALPRDHGVLLAVKD